MAFQISPSPRIERSPYYAATVADGVTAFSTYNHMLMPTSYGDPQAEYRRLTEGVAMWDVAVERQVELAGPDAGTLVRILTPRRLDHLAPGQGRYVAICDHRGTLINDPVLLKLAEDRIWLSIADGDLALWARAIAAERGLHVQVNVLPVAPLAVQGPHAAGVAAALFGEEVRGLPPFAFRRVMLSGMDLLVGRSGWSGEDGFEIYLQDPARGIDLWERVRAAGRPWNIGPGAPNPAERIESGLLSCGGDTDDRTNPFEVRMGRYVDLETADAAIGIGALRRIAAEGPQRHQLGVVLDTDDPAPTDDLWCEITVDGVLAGHLTASAVSPRIGARIGIALIDRRHGPGDRVTVTLPDGQRVGADLRALPFR